MHEEKVEIVHECYYFYYISACALCLKERTQWQMFIKTTLVLKGAWHIFIFLVSPTWQLSAYKKTKYHLLPITVKQHPTEAFDCLFSSKFFQEECKYNYVLRTFFPARSQADEIEK